MKKLLCFLITNLALTTLKASVIDYCDITQDFLTEFTTGYRQDQLKIHTTASTPTDAIISENDFSDISIFQARLTAKSETSTHVYACGYLNYGRIVEFHQKLSAPTLVLKPSNTHHEKGRVYDAEYAFGYSMYLCEEARLTPIGGYSYHRLEFDSHNRVFRTNPAVSEEEAEHNYNKVVCKQRTTWRAPFVGLEAEVYPLECLRVCVNGQYLWAHYNNHGTAKEKYTQTYRYKQRSNGYGTIFNGEIGYAFLEGWEVLLTGAYQRFQVKGGQDKTTHSPEPEVKSKLHLASWRSYEVSLGLSYAY